MELLVKEGMMNKVMLYHTIIFHHKIYTVKFFKILRFFIPEYWFDLYAGYHKITQCIELRIEMSRKLLWHLNQSSRSLNIYIWTLWSIWVMTLIESRAPPGNRSIAWNLFQWHKQSTRIDCGYFPKIRYPD